MTSIPADNRPPHEHHISPLRPGHNEPIAITTGEPTNTRHAMVLPDDRMSAGRRF